MLALPRQLLLLCAFLRPEKKLHFGEARKEREREADQTRKRSCCCSSCCYSFFEETHSEKYGKTTSSEHRQAPRERSSTPKAPSAPAPTKALQPPFLVVYVTAWSNRRCRKPFSFRGALRSWVMGFVGGERCLCVCVRVCVYVDYAGVTIIIMVCPPRQSKQHTEREEEEDWLFHHKIALLRCSARHSKARPVGPTFLALSPLSFSLWRTHALFFLFSFRRRGVMIVYIYIIYTYITHNKTASAWCWMHVQLTLQ